MLNNNKQNEILYYQAYKATNEELIRMYIKGENKYAKDEMKQRGIY